MYAGSTLTTFSGVILGAHQRIDRAAYRELQRLSPGAMLPHLKTVLYFEGNNGPDGVKRKSPAKDEPWHYFQPFDAKDTQLLAQLEDHHAQLVAALKAKDGVRAAFEFAWISHAAVDGLTPAHHYPYEEKLSELRGGLPNETRTTIGKKLIMPGMNPAHMLSNNWKMWGPKGLFTTHAAFEWGVAVLLAQGLKSLPLVTPDKLQAFEELPLSIWYRNIAQEVARLDLYHDFYQSGWTIPLARRVRKQLVPALISSVSLIWYGAVTEAYQ